MGKKILILLLLLSSPALAGSFIKLGGSLNTPSIYTNKMISLGLQDEWFSIFDYQLEGGYFVDNTSLTIGRTAFISPSVGVSVKNNYYYTKAFFGPALVSRTDDHLNTPYQFNTDFQFGLRDNRDVEIGVGYKHLSNGGITSPNLGRDFFYLQIQIPL